MAYVNATVGSNTAKVTTVTDGSNTLATLSAVVENDSNLTVTANGTYNATQDGYKKVVVDVPASGGGAMVYATGDITFTDQPPTIVHNLGSTRVMAYLYSADDTSGTFAAVFTSASSILPADWQGTTFSKADVDSAIASTTNQYRTCIGIRNNSGNIGINSNSSNSASTDSYAGGIWATDENTIQLGFSYGIQTGKLYKYCVFAFPV